MSVQDVRVTDVFRRAGRVAVLCAATALAGSAGAQEAPKPSAAEDVPQVLLDKSPRVIAYQLKRLTNAQLARVDRKPDDPKYKPIYEALLTRKGMDRKFREEAVAALASIDKSDPVVELLNGIGAADPDDKSTLRELMGLLMAQKPSALAAQREKIQSLAAESQNPVVKQAAYGALVAGGTKVDDVWKQAEDKSALASLVSAIPLVNESRIRAGFYPHVNALVTAKAAAPDDPARLAAIETLGSIPGHEEVEFKELAGLIKSGPPAVRDAAVRSIRRIPADQWPQEQLAALGDTLVKLVKDTPVDQRTSAGAVQEIQLGNDLAAELPDEQGVKLRKQLRDLGVRVVLIRTLREQMLYDTRYFAVQAGKPVEIVLENGDAMPHNIVITAPHAMQEVAVAAGVMPPPSDPAAKAYIPDSPKVLQATRLVQPDESEALSFNAPTEPGEYDFICTFPGHWVRMYGVMLVVPDLDAYEKNPKAPKDPLTGKSFDSPKNEAPAAH